jgi:hypothetical protein
MPPTIDLVFILLHPNSEIMAPAMPATARMVKIKGGESLVVKKPLDWPAVVLVGHKMVVELDSGPVVLICWASFLDRVK